MDNTERDNLLNNAHQKYINWWLPMDIQSGSSLGAMAYNRFLESLLTYSDDWWVRWIGDDIPLDKKIAFKVYILKIIKNKTWLNVQM